MNDMKRILVVSRSTKHCQKAVHYGVLLARQQGAELYILHLFDDPFCLEHCQLPIVSLQSIQEEYRHMQEKAKADLEKLAKAERANGLPIQVIIRDGVASKEILQVVEEEKIDLLILLAHEEGRLEHMLFERTNDELLRKLPCSILFVKKEPERLPY
jgi:universal stress protein A